jgi:hypothetical protein
MYCAVEGEIPHTEENFEGDWPVKATIQSFLKNTSAKLSTAKSK